MKIPLVDLQAQYNSIKGEIDQAIARVIERGEFILGPEVKAFEEEVAAYLGVKYAVGVASGTEALQLALLACGIGQGDEVITTPFTFIATAEAITQCGATPVFVDIDPKTYNIDPRKLAELLSTNSPRPRRERTKVKVNSKNSTNSMNSELGRRVGSLGDAGCLSFFPSKVLGAYGDGGMVVTNDPETGEKVRMLRNHGAKQKYYHLIPGFNSRLDEIQAAILRVKLRHLDRWIAQRRQKASVYAELLNKIEGIEPPYIAPDSYHIFNYYTIRVKNSRGNRGKLREYLNSQGIATAIYYPLSLHLQEVYKPLRYQLGDFPESERAQEEVLSLPIYPELEEEQIKRIVDSIAEFLKVAVRTKS